MKITFQQKTVFGFIVNFAILSCIGIIYFFKLKTEFEQNKIETLDWVAFGLIIISLALLAVVYFIIENQNKAREQAQQSLTDNKQLLQSIIDNTTNPIYIKKLNGEYLFINKPFESLFNISHENIIGKTDHDFLSKEIADKYRASDLEVVKAGKELKVEEVIIQDNIPHTYISSKFPLFDASGRIYAIGSIATNINERKKMEESLHEEENFFKMSLDILVVAKDDKFIKINPALSHMLGYTDEELLSKPFTSFIHKEDIERTSEEIQKLQTGIKTVNFVNRYVAKNGDIKWLSWTAMIDPNSRKFYAIAHDVTETINYQESLKLADTFFNMSFEIMVVANKDYFIKINPAFTKILGYTQEDMNKPFLSFVHSDDFDKAKDAVEKTIKGEPMINFRVRARCKDNSYKWVEWNVTADLKNGLFYAVARDISENIRLEEEQEKNLKQLFENEQKLRLILENISDGVIVSDSKNQVILANNSANGIFGIDEDSKLTNILLDQYDLFFPDEKTVFPSQNLPLNRALNGEAIDDVDLVMCNKETHAKKRVLISVRPLVDQENHVVAAVETIKDISRYKQLEKDLKETEMKYRHVIGYRHEPEEL